MYYWADTYSRQIKRGDEYEKLNKTISIVILDHEIEELKGIEKMGVKWQIRDNETGKRALTDRLEIVIIEIPKAKRIYKENKANRIGQWMIFLDNPNNKEVVQIMNFNKEIEEAYDELEKVSGNEELRRIAELKIKGIRDRKAELDYAIEHGIKKRNIEIVKNMLKENADIAFIARVTGLTEDEIKKLK